MISLIIIVSMVAIANLVYFYLQQVNEKASLDSLLNQHIALQNQSGKSIANSIGTDLGTMMNMIENVAHLESEKYVISSAPQYNNISNSTLNHMLDFLNREINHTYDIVKQKADRLYIVNNSGIVTNSFTLPGEDKFLGLDLSFRDYVNQTKESMKPVYSELFTGADSKNRITLTYPILKTFGLDGANHSGFDSEETNKSSNYLGLVAVSMPVSEMFDRYGNIFNIETQFLVGYDKNGTIMISPRSEFIGKNFMSPEIQEVIDKGGVFNRIINSLLNGNEDQGLYTTESGERYNTAFPIFVDGNMAYGLAVVTPTNSIYQSMNEILHNERIQSAVLFFTMSAGVIIVFILLRSWNKDLGNEVKKRTIELDEANHRLGIVNEKLVASEKAKEEFISMVSHELRTPLMPIKAYAGMLLKPKYMGEINRKQKKALDSILRNVTTMERLVGDVLDVYRLEMNRLRLSLQEITVKTLLDNAISEFEQIIKTQDSEKKIQLNAELKVSEDLKIQCDPQRINQVLGNLIKNSIDFVPADNGKINVSVEYYNDSQDTDQKTANKSNKILITVEDNGPGIPPDKIDSMFRKFYQIDTSLTRKHGGTGLGLVICKGIIESHEGTIWIDRNYKEGASFRFTLPI
ncbi:sensor histidine kinase [Candidatus Nitrosocosmicus sp. T]